MKLERERVGLTTSTYRGVDTNPPLRWNPIDTSGVHPAMAPVDILRLQEIGIKGGLQEVRFNIHQEENKKEEKENPQKQRRDGFEPFVDSKDPLKPSQKKEGQMFVNVYGGNYAQNMQLNIKGVEGILKIAHLDGQVFLSSLSPNRQRSIEANPDGSVSAKRFLILGEKIEKEEKENPLYKVVSVPQGWRIEVNDQKLT